jgi:predicted PurR-regulated permease PerM
MEPGGLRRRRIDREEGQKGVPPRRHEGVSPIKKKFWPLTAKDLSNLIIVLIGILFYVVLSNLTAIRLRIGVFLNVVKPFIIGFAIAYLLNTPVTFFEKKVYSRLQMKRGLAVATVYLLALIVAAVLLTLILPQVVSSIMTLINNIEGYLDNLNALVDDLVTRFNLDEGGLDDGIDSFIVSYEGLMKQLINQVSAALPKLLNYGVALGNGIVAAITALISSIYMLSGKNVLTAQLKKLLFALFPAERVERVLQVCRRANGIFVGFINGKLLDSAIIGVLCFILCSILRIPYAPLISVFIGVTNVIPFFGPLIGAIPSVMLLVIVNPWAALRFVIMIIALQQFDGNILGPKILGNSTGLSAIWVLVAIVVGGGLFGFPGMILGVPTFAVIYMLTREFVAKRLTVKHIDGEGRPLPTEAEPPEPENDRK